MKDITNQEQNIVMESIRNRSAKAASDFIQRASSVDPGTVYLVIDCSGSMSVDNKLDKAKRGAESFAEDAKTKGYLTGLITFESVATHICEPQRDLAVLSRHLDRIDTDGSTNMAAGISLATRKLQDSKGNRAIVIITDGAPDSEAAALDAAREAKRKEIDIITIGTDDADHGFLRKLASRTDLAVKTSGVQLQQSITSAAKMLPGREAPRLGGG